MTDVTAGPSRYYWDKPEEAQTTMNTTAAAVVLQAKFDHQNKQLGKAIANNDQAKIEQIQTRINTIMEEAEDAGVELRMLGAPAATPKPEPAATEPEQAEPVADDAEVESTGTAQPPTPTTKPSIKDLNKERLAKLKASKDKAKEAKEAKKAGVAAPKKEKKPTKTHDCLCGCGGETLSLFSPGHDARVKGIILKVERGDLDRDAIPESVQPFVKFQGKWKTDSFKLTAAPVKIPNRDDVKHTGLEAMEALDV